MATLEGRKNEGLFWRNLDVEGCGSGNLVGDQKQ
jgi:hypothetical protein